MFRDTFPLHQDKLSWIVGIQGLLSSQDAKCNPIIGCKHYLKANLITMRYLCLELVIISKVAVYTVLICVFCGGSELSSEGHLGQYLAC